MGTLLGSPLRESLSEIRDPRVAGFTRIREAVAGLRSVSVNTRLELLAGFWWGPQPMKPPMLGLFLLIAVTGLAARGLDYAANIASLINLGKLATLKPRGANPRIQKCVYWLEEARRAGQNPTDAAHRAVLKAGYRDSPAVLTEEFRFIR
jgi:hypothetical protein